MLEGLLRDKSLQDLAAQFNGTHQIHGLGSTTCPRYTKDAYV